MERNEILFRELLRLGRARRTYFLRGVAPLAIGVLLLALFVSENVQTGIYAFRWLMVAFNVFAFVAMPLLISGVLHEEWQSNTLSVLFLAETTLSSILRGILGSRVIIVLASLVACFPLLISVMNFGGVTSTQMVQFSTLIVSLTVFYGAFAMWANCVCRTREMALLFTFGILGVPQLVCAYWFQIGAKEWGSLPEALGIAPSVVMLQLTEGTIPWGWSGRHGQWAGAASLGEGFQFGWLSLQFISLALASVFFLLARRSLGRRIVTSEGAKASGPADAPPVRVEEKRGREHTTIVGNPISWLVLKRFDPLFGVPKLVAVVIAFALTIGLEVLDETVSVAVARDAVLFLGLALMAWTFLWACLVSAQMWMEERTERTMELLLATPYTLDEVILWKVDALFWALIAPATMYSALCSTAIWSFQHGTSLALKLFLIAPFTLCCFLYSYVGLFVVVYVTIFFAMRAASAVQAVLSTFGLIGATIFVNLLGFGLGTESGLFLIAVLYDFVLLAAFVPAFRKRLRTFELR